MMVAADQHLDRPGSDLRGADQGAQRNGGGKSDVLRPEDAQQVDRDDR